MVKTTHNIILHAIKVAQFLSINCDEMMIMDNQSWLNIHAYVVNKWQQVSNCGTFGEG
jgi:hypothetical protein